jgi:hypothetical protein
MIVFIQDTSPSQFQDGQQIMCTETFTLAGVTVTKDRLYTVEHACQYGPAVVLVGKLNFCYPDRLFRAVELLPDEALSMLLEDALERHLNIFTIA